MSYTVRAKRWRHGWELHISRGNTAVGVTQSRTIASAEQVVRDYLATLYDLDKVTDEVAIVPELGGLERRAAAARKLTREAESAQRSAARESREVARALRGQGLSVSDTAEVLGVSRGRVSQLLRTSPAEARARRAPEIAI